MICDVGEWPKYGCHSRNKQQRGKVWVFDAPFWDGFGVISGLRETWYPVKSHGHKVLQPGPVILFHLS